MIPDHDKKFIRLFIAFPCPEELKNMIREVNRDNQEIKEIRWTPEENLHVTLFFIGEVLPVAVDSVLKNVASTAGNLKSFQLPFKDFSVENRQRKSGMVWCRLTKSEEFSNVNRLFHESLKEFMLNKTTIHDPLPHITLARFSKIDFKVELKFPANSSNNPFWIDACEVWQSISTPDGVRYKRLERFELATVTLA